MVSMIVRGEIWSLRVHLFRQDLRVEGSDGPDHIHTHVGAGGGNFLVHDFLNLKVEYGCILRKGRVSNPEDPSNMY